MLRITPFALAALCVIALAGCQTYIGRMLTLRTIDVEDYRHLPTRPVLAAPGATPLESALTQDWISQAPFDAGGRRLTSQAELDAFMESHDTTALVVLQNGKLVDERYYNGYTRDALFKTFSMSKSLLSALVGIAQSDGVLDVTEPVGNYVPLEHNPQVAVITLEQLGDNVSGLRYRRGIAPWKEQPRMYYTSDVRALLREVEVVRPPGQVFEAEELSPLLLAYALEQALVRKYPEMTLARYTQERIWQPMGAQYDALWVIDHAGTGLEKSESGFVARAVDLARFGQLYLDAGRAQGRQLVPESWVAASVSEPPAKSPTLTHDGFHRKLWWAQNVEGRTTPDFYANGHFGQRIYVNPDKKLVLVRLGKDGAGINWTAVMGRISQAWVLLPTTH